MNQFKFKKDPLFAFIFFCITVLGLTAAIVNLGKSPVGVADWIVLGVLLFFFGLQIWIWNTANYEITPQQLVYQMGPIKGSIPLADIQTVFPSTYHTALNHPALALKGLRLVYGKGYELFIAPQEQERFIQTLVAQNGNIKFEA